MSVWVATYGSVDDFHLYGVFTTREKAVAAVGHDPEFRPTASYWWYQIDEVTIDDVRQIRI